MNRRFRDDVYNLVCAIPKGRVMTYGQIAALCGHPNAARVVGQIAHFGPEYIPWHRVVNCKGGMARGFSWGGKTGQGRLLSEEGVKIIDDYLILANYLWRPEK